MVRRRGPITADRPVQVVTWSGGAPIRRVPIALARRFVQICLAVAAETLEGENLTPLQFAVLANLNDEADVDQNSLAARLGVDRNSASVLVEQLEKRGLIDRRVNGAAIHIILINNIPCLGHDSEIRSGIGRHSRQQ